MRGQQPAEALPIWMGAGNGIKRGEMARFHLKTEQEACYMPPSPLQPVRLSPQTSPANRRVSLGKTLCQTDS
jgi:hypothetical protein